MPVGTVKWYDPDKGFGFIAQEEGGADLFLHHTMVGSETLAEGDRLSFSIGRGLKGERAEDIRVIERSGNAPRPRRQNDSGNGGFEGRSGGYGRSAGDYGGADDRQPSVDPSALPRMEGVVRRFDPERGFGFISSAQTAEDVFFHGSVVVGGTVSSGDEVEFNLGQGQRGPRAMQVRPLRAVR